MKQLIQSVVVAGLIPAMMISAISNSNSQITPKVNLEEETVNSCAITVLNSDGERKTMELDAYILGVLLGEVSTDFHQEALKSQAVAARTYTLYCIDILKKHGGGAVCTDYHCCQAYCEPESYLSGGGTTKGLATVADAVEETTGEVLLYDASLICATYFASSGGVTEDALEVWGEPYPYLQSVSSTGEEECGYFSKQVSFTPAQLQDALGVELAGSPESWFGMVRYTVGGGVDLMRIGGKLYTGTELRNLLKLRSTIITVTASDDEIIIDTKGYGHRVGMSQHGANAMARAGKGYHEILQHYYTDITISHYEKEVTDES